jgi:Arc/MetJ-type ribon-helix-helix transcriptional regulator
MQVHMHMRSGIVKTIQMTIDEPLLEEVDQRVKALKTSRSAFVREALERALRRYAIAELEAKHAAGYAKHPIVPGEFDDWEDEQAWGPA